MILNSELILEDAKFKYLDYLDKTDQLSESKVFGALFNEQIAAEDSNIVKYFLKESIINDKNRMLGKEDLIQRFIKKGKELEDLLKKAEKSSKSEKKKKLIKKQIAKIEEAIYDLETGVGEKGTTVVIINAIYIYFVVFFAFLATKGIILTGINIHALLTSSMGVTTLNPIVIGVLLTALAGLTVTIIIGRKIVNYYNNREIPEEEKKRIVARVERIVKTTKEKLKKLEQN